MKKVSLKMGALVGLITSLPVIALLYLGEQFAGLPFVPFDLFDWLTRTLPGNIITAGIGTIVNIVRGLNLGPTDATAKLIEQTSALSLVVVGAVLLGATVAGVLNRSRASGVQIGGIAGLVALVVVAAIELSLGLTHNVALALGWLALVIIGWGALLGQRLAALQIPHPPTSTEERMSRRAALLKIAGGSAAVALVGWGLGSLFKQQQEATGAGQPLANLATSTPTATPNPTATASATPTPQTQATAMAETTATAGPSATPTATPSPTATPTPLATATARERVKPAPGTRPELTANEDFYRIDINTRPVTIEGKSWVLEVAGLFDDPRPLMLADLMAYPSVTQPITLSCISNPIAGDLISTSNWTGVRLRDVLKDLGLQPEAKQLAIKAADGFYESVTMEDMMDPRTLLVYGMNGETLPVEHGFPLRIYIPNRYGMKQPKWITHIEAIPEEGAGYWVDRGWSKEAHPQIVSVIDTVAVDQPVDGKIPVGGIAWAGDRGIQTVELQVDGGEWLESTLRTPPLSGLTWVQWRYNWPGESGRHTFTVRAVDGNGTPQIEKRSDPHPNGATGYHSVEVTV